MEILTLATILYEYSNSVRYGELESARVISQIDDDLTSSGVVTENTERSSIAPEHKGVPPTAGVAVATTSGVPTDGRLEYAGSYSAARTTILHVESHTLPSGKVLSGALARKFNALKVDRIRTQSRSQLNDIAGPDDFGNDEAAACDVAPFCHGLPAFPPHASIVIGLNQLVKRVYRNISLSFALRYMQQPTYQHLLVWCQSHKPEADWSDVRTLCDFMAVDSIFRHRTPQWPYTKYDSVHAGAHQSLGWHPSAVALTTSFGFAAPQSFDHLANLLYSRALACAWNALMHALFGNTSATATITGTVPGRSTTPGINTYSFIVPYSESLFYQEGVAHLAAAATVGGEFPNLFGCVVSDSTAVGAFSELSLTSSAGSAYTVSSAVASTQFGRSFTVTAHATSSGAVAMSGSARYKFDTPPSALDIRFYNGYPNPVRFTLSFSNVDPELPTVSVPEPLWVTNYPPGAGFTAVQAAKRNRTKHSEHGNIVCKFGNTTHREIHTIRLQLARAQVVGDPVVDLQTQLALANDRDREYVRQRGTATRRWKSCSCSLLNDELIRVETPNWTRQRDAPKILPTTTVASAAYAATAAMSSSAVTAWSYIFENVTEASAPVITNVQVVSVAWEVFVALPPACAAACALSADDTFAPVSGKVKYPVLKQWSLRGSDINETSITLRGSSNFTSKTSPVTASTLYFHVYTEVACSFCVDLRVESIPYGGKSKSVASGWNRKMRTEHGNPIVRSRRMPIVPVDPPIEERIVATPSAPAPTIDPASDRAEMPPEVTPPPESYVPISSDYIAATPVPEVNAADRVLAWVGSLPGPLQNHWIGKYKSAGSFPITFATPADVMVAAKHPVTSRIDAAAKDHDFMLAAARSQEDIDHADQLLMDRLFEAGRLGSAAAVVYGYAKDAGVTPVFTSPPDEAVANTINFMYDLRGGDFYSNDAAVAKSEDIDHNHEAKVDTGNTVDVKIDFIIPSELRDQFRTIVSATREPVDKARTGFLLREKKRRENAPAPGREATPPAKQEEEKKLALQDAEMTAEHDEIAKSVDKRLSRPLMIQSDVKGFKDSVLSELRSLRRDLSALSTKQWIVEVAPEDFDQGFDAAYEFCGGPEVFDVLFAAGKKDSETVRRYLRSVVTALLCCMLVGDADDLVVAWSMKLDWNHIAHLTYGNILQPFEMVDPTAPALELYVRIAVQLGLFDANDQLMQMMLNIDRNHQAHMVYGNIDCEFDGPDYDPVASISDQYAMFSAAVRFIKKREEKHVPLPFDNHTMNWIFVQLEQCYFRPRNSLVTRVSTPHWNGKLHRQLPFDTAIVEGVMVYAGYQRFLLIPSGDYTVKIAPAGAMNMITTALQNFTTLADTRLTAAVPGAINIDGVTIPQLAGALSQYVQSAVANGVDLTRYWFNYLCWQYSAAMKESTDTREALYCMSPPIPYEAPIDMIEFAINPEPETTVFRVVNYEQWWQLRTAGLPENWDFRDTAVFLPTNRAIGPNNQIGVTMVWSPRELAMTLAGFVPLGMEDDDSSYLTKPYRRVGNTMWVPEFTFIRTRDLDHPRYVYIVHNGPYSWAPEVVWGVWDEEGDQHYTNVDLNDIIEVFNLSAMDWYQWSISMMENISADNGSSRHYQIAQSIFSHIYTWNMSSVTVVDDYDPVANVFPYVYAPVATYADYFGRPQEVYRQGPNPDEATWSAINVPTWNTVEGIGMLLSGWVTLSDDVGFPRSVIDVQANLGDKLSYMAPYAFIFEGCLINLCLHAAVESIKFETGLVTQNITAASADVGNAIPAGPILRDLVTNRGYVEYILGGASAAFGADLTWMPTRVLSFARDPVNTALPTYYTSATHAKMYFPKSKGFWHSVITGADAKWKTPTDYIVGNEIVLFGEPSPTVVGTVDQTMSFQLASVFVANGPDITCRSYNDEVNATFDWLAISDYFTAWAIGAYECTDGTVTRHFKKIAGQAVFRPLFYTVDRANKAWSKVPADFQMIQPDSQSSAELSVYAASARTLNASAMQNRLRRVVVSSFDGNATKNE